MPVQYTDFLNCKKGKFSVKRFKLFSFFSFPQNIGCGYTIEQPQRGGSNIIYVLGQK